MKLKLFLPIILILFFTSCKEILYEQPQPEGVASLSFFPDELHGVYSDNNDTVLIIGKTALTYVFFESEMKTELSDELILKECEGYYFLNLKTDNNNWECFILKLENNMLRYYYLNPEEENLELIKKMVQIQQIDNAEGEVGYYLINPSKNQLFQLLNNNLYGTSILQKK